MDKEKQLRNFIKATLPIIEGMDLDLVIESILYLAAYIAKTLQDPEIAEPLKKGTVAMIVSCFNYNTYHYLDEVVEEFKEEGIFFTEVE